VEGRPFGQYRLLTLIGRGGMGEVWRAHDTNTDRVVALKVLPPHLADDEMFQKRFRREARVAAALYEPHVVPIHGYGEIDGHLYVDMRLIVGEDLETVLKRGPLEPARAVGIIEQVAAALQAAHKEGLVHRDVKPSNILVTDTDFAYLIDFGIARTAGSTGLTSTGSTIGTWAYMAPERFGMGEPDPRSDVYALACVLHQAMTGHRPFPGDSVEQQVAGHLSTPPPRPSSLNSRVPQAFDDVIANGMAKSVDQRYSTAGELAVTARAALDGLQPTALATAHPHDQGPTQQAAPSVPAPSAATQMAATQYRDPADVPPDSEPPNGSAPTPWWRRPSRVIPAAAVVVAIVVFVSTVLITQGGEKDSDTAIGPTTSAAPPAPTGPSFDGTFTVSWDSARTGLNGEPQSPSTFEPRTWVVRSFCDRSGCVANSTTVDRPEGVQTFSFDYIDGRWIGVSEETDDSCKDTTSQRWRVYSLQPQPDGSLTGEYTSMSANRCLSRQTATLTRTGDADPGVQVTDPAILPPRVPSPAQGFRGRYHHVLQLTTGTQEKTETDYTVLTACLRSGDRCLSYAASPGFAAPLQFADNQWTLDLITDTGKCRSGELRHDVQHRVYPLPQPATDPFPIVSGTGQTKYSGPCTGDQEFTVTFTRTGD
jgi:serine/threonine protein kinase